MKKILKLTALVMTVILIMSAAVIPSGAMSQRKINKNSFVTDYPFVFVHGMGGWGPTNSFYDKSPYWGGGLSISDTDLIKILNSQGVKAYAVQVGPLNSAWDRACELYAQLTGTVTDYGEAHSKAHGHDRYGFSYIGNATMGKPWNLKDKINLVGHSFGGATIRLFSSLMTYGAPEEVKATGDSTSALFKGGHNNIHACVTLSAPHNGTQVCNMIYDLKVPFLFLCFAYNFVGAVFGNNFLVFSMQMSHFGLTPAQNKKRTLISPEKIINYYTAEDNCYSDMTIRGARALNETVKLSPDTYYYSYSTSATTPTGIGGRQKIVDSVTPIFKISSSLIAISEGKTYDGIKISGNWAVNDGIVPLASALYPESDKSTATDYENALAENKKIKKGRWYYMDTIVGMDHFDFCGTEDYPVSFEDFYFSMVETVNSR